MMNLATDARLHTTNMVNTYIFFFFLRGGMLVSLFPSFVSALNNHCVSHQVAYTQRRQSVIQKTLVFFME